MDPSMQPMNENMVKLMEEMQMKDSLRMYNGLVERCFSECVTSFHSGKLSGPEQQCINNCVQKFMKYSQRVGQQFAEQSEVLQKR